MNQKQRRCLGRVAKNYSFFSIFGIEGIVDKVKNRTRKGCIGFFMLKISKLAILKLIQAPNPSFPGCSFGRYNVDRIHKDKTEGISSFSVATTFEFCTCIKNQILISTFNNKDRFFFYTETSILSRND